MYYTYIMRCEDNSLYTGITTDVQRRFRQHRGEIKGGAKYTKARFPVSVEIVWESDCKSKALSLEYYIKKLSKSDKEDLIKNPETLETLLGDKIDINQYRLPEVSNMIKEKILALTDETWEFLGEVKADMSLGMYSLFWGRGEDGYDFVINGTFEEFDEAGVCIAPEIICTFGDEKVTYSKDADLMDFVYKQLHSSEAFEKFRNEYEKLQYEGVTTYFTELIKEHDFLFLEQDEVEAEDGIAVEFNGMLESGLFVSGLIYEIEDEYRNSVIDFVYDELLYVSLDDINYFVEDPYLKDYIVYVLDNVDYTC